MTKRTKIRRSRKSRTRSKKSEASVKTLKCAPGTISVSNRSCYTEDNITKIKNVLNARLPENEQITSTNNDIILQEIGLHFENACDNERCWLKQNFVKNGLSEEERNEMTSNFAPNAPNEWKDNPNTWLSSLDIKRVMKQYEKAYSCFRFLGPSPIDYDTIVNNECVWPELCFINLKEFHNNGITKVGITFNLDPHYKSGSHWVTLFVHISENYIFYFDSGGAKPHSNIVRLIKKLKRQLKLINNSEITYYENDVEHQKENTECGMYSLYFIVSLLKDDKHPEHFLDRNGEIHDDEVFKLRQEYFNH